MKNNSASHAKALAPVVIYDSVERILQNEPRGRLLDVPTGEGALAKRLKDIGFDVSAADLYPEIFKLLDVEIKSADLDSTLPYEDNSFDYVVCVAGLGHVENPANAVREFARILRPNGQVIVNIPNILNVEERLKWLLYGYTSHYKPPSREALAAIQDNQHGSMEEVWLQHNTIGYSEMRFLLEKNGFVVRQMAIDKPKLNAWLYFPITGLIRLLGKFNSPEKRRMRWTDELNSKEVLRGGNTLIFQAILKRETS